MSGNITLDSMKKKETVAMCKILEVLKVLGKSDPDRRHAPRISLYEISNE
jgi:hypothetical protein